MNRSATDANRAAWDLLVPIHERSEFYDVQAFVDGRLSLRQLEKTLVGPCDGRDLLHLQCHFGLDSLSWARLGARVTGVDFSPVAIATARRLSEVSAAQATFHCADVQQLPFEAEYDIVVTTYGVMCWVENLHAWAEGVARALRPSGRFVLVDFHPILETIHPGKMTGASSYFGSVTPSIVRTQGSYADRSACVEYHEHRWQHPVSAIFRALITAGLDVTGFDEYGYCSYGLFDELTQTEPGVWAPKSPAAWPYMFSLQARKAASPCNG